MRQLPPLDYHEELRAAALAKGQGLTGQEMARAMLRARFRRVILMAGYTSNGGEKILAEYFDDYMKPENLDGFKSMLVDYEKNYGDPL